MRHRTVWKMPSQGCYQWFTGKKKKLILTIHQVFLLGLILFNIFHSSLCDWILSVLINLQMIWSLQLHRRRGLKFKTILTSCRNNQENDSTKLKGILTRYFSLAGPFTCTIRGQEKNDEVIIWGRIRTLYAHYKLSVSSCYKKKWLKYRVRSKTMNWSFHFTLRWWDIAVLSHGTIFPEWCTPAGRKHQQWSKDQTA